MNVSDLVPLVNKEMGYGTAISVTPGIGTGRGTLMFDPSPDDGDSTSDRIIQDCPDDRTDSLVILDVADSEASFGANPIAIPDGTPEAYRTRTVDIVLPLLDKYFGLTERTMTTRQYVRSLLRVMTYVPGATLCDASTFIESDSAQAMALCLVPDPAVRAELADGLSVLDEEEKVMLANRMRRLMTTDVLRHVFGQSRLTINVKEMLEDGKTIMFRVPSSRMEVSFCRDMLMSGGYELMFPSAVWSVGFVTDTDNEADAGALHIPIVMSDAEDSTLAGKAERLSEQAREAGYVRPVSEIDREVRDRTQLIADGRINELINLYANHIDDWQR